MYTFSQNIEEVIKKFDTDPDQGLKNDEVKTRRDRYGLNQLEAGVSRSALRILLEQVNNVLTYILLISIFLSLLAGHTVDAFVIGILVIINISVGFYLEYKAEKRIESLRNMIKYNCLVIRNGKEYIIDTTLLVPGDIVLLEEGEAVPADIRLINSDELAADESSLTGESVPQEKKAGKLPNKTLLADRINMLYMGTHLTRGVAKGVVVATGLSTEFGGISREIDSMKEGKSLFYKRTESLMKKMISISFIFALITVTILYLRSTPGEEIIQFSFAALISGIPEGLPSILTVLLSIASVKMSKQKALLRNLPAIETLSTTTTIITDKTGTLTENVMNIGEVLLKNKNLITITGTGWKSKGNFLKNNKKLKIGSDKDLDQLLQYLAITSNGDAVKKNGKYELVGYPTEISRYIIAKKAGYTRENTIKNFQIFDSEPYSQETKYKSYILKKIDEDKRFLVVIGGAERVLEISKKNDDFSNYVRTNALQGFRMQVVSYKYVESEKISQVEFKDLEPLAVLRIADPMRKDVPNAIVLAKNAGIRVIMATGDHLSTAFAIAKESGIIDQKADIEQINKYALSQEDIDRMSDGQFVQNLDRYNVFARVTPKTKIRIANVLHQKGEIIAMTGDGVNDAPVLKKADIGIAMGQNGTDVAKEASDLILLDDSFSTIVDAVKEGRTVYKNIRRTSLYLIITNLAEDLLILMSVLAGLPLPLLPIQILWLNLVTDGITDMALATEEAEDTVLDEKPVSKEIGILHGRDYLNVFLIGLLMAIISGSFYLYYFDSDIEKARSMAFSSMVFMQLFNVINMRALRRPVWEKGYFSNKALNYSIMISIFLFFTAMSIPPIREIFQFATLSIREISFVIVLSSMILVFGELYKYFIRSRLETSESILN